MRNVAWQLNWSTKITKNKLKLNRNIFLKIKKYSKQVTQLLKAKQIKVYKNKTQFEIFVILK